MFNLDFLKNKKKFVKHGVQHDPSIYWMVIFLLGFVLTVVAFIFGSYVFMRINEEDIQIQVPPSKQLQKISKDRIQKNLDLFKEREQKSLDILSKPSPFIDPSL
jgi:hypothetical protein